MKDDKLQKIIFPTINGINYDMMGTQRSGAIEMYNPSLVREHKRLPIVIPNKCPCCGKTLATSLVPVTAANNTSSINQYNDDDEQCEITECEVASIYMCTSCTHLFIVGNSVKPIKIKEADEYNDVEYELQPFFSYEYPVSEGTIEFSNEITTLSPRFNAIFKQAEKAELSGLDAICGMGYRRSLEYLVCDYAVHKYPNKLHEIECATLSNKIKNYISDVRIQTLAERATWLGNDQTHTVTKHNDRSIEDMKRFIVALAKFIDADLAVEDAQTIQRK